jgi:hypothetical protein
MYGGLFLGEKSFDLARVGMNVRAPLRKGHLPDHH